MAADEGVAHLQAAAREMVAAAREFLDAVEQVVEDDDRMSRVVGGLADLFHQASDAMSRMGRDPSHGPSGEDRVRHIVVE
jgi:F420-dependent methylenetetrahydromethanopterin dehydrogenase